MIFSIFIELCDPHRNLTLEHFFTLIRKLVPLLVLLCPPAHPPPPPATTNPRSACGFADSTRDRWPSVAGFLHRAPHFRGPSMWCGVHVSVLHSFLQRPAFCLSTHRLLAVCVASASWPLRVMPPGGWCSGLRGADACQAAIILSVTLSSRGQGCLLRPSFLCLSFAVGCLVNITPRS